MPARMSNRDRIARLAAEKAAGDKEKEVAKTTKKTKATKKPRSTSAKTTKASRASAAKPAMGMKLVWVVCDNTGGVVKAFPYPERKAADTEAARLTTSKGKTHFVKTDKVPME